MITLDRRQQMLILLVEDRPDDVLLFKRALAAARVPNPVFVVPDGRMAARYLAGVEPFRNHSEFPLPDLMVLDLKMPGMSGFELLSWVRQQPGIECLRTLILTSSEDSEDLARCMDLGANSFMTKPFEFSSFVELAKTLSGHWLDHSIAPQLFRPPAGSSPEF